MTEFEHNVILMMKCLNKRLSEIVEQLHEMNGHTESFYMSKDEENEAEEDE
ncbi:MAG: hypothetical protein IJ784_12705 [Ruminiclostridium sp.]|nr:hypothetical protein [Ruminiclostridium sp.]